MKTGSDLAYLEEQRLGSLAISTMKRFLGVPLTERIVSPGREVWAGKNDYLSLRLEHLDISNDYPWWCKVEVRVGRVSFKLLGMGNSEREVRSTVREALAYELKDVRDLFNLLQKLTRGVSRV